MEQHINAILFDVGGTLRRATNREFPEKVILCKKILELTGYGMDPVEFTRLLDERANAYRKWSRENLAELEEAGFWTQWMLPGFEPEKIRALAVDLNRVWRNADRAYQVVPDAGETILGLFRAGYRLGVVSNTTSSIEAPDLLKELGVTGCFDAVVLSCQIGIRKPRPEMLLEAVKRMGVRPEQCAYIGNLPDRDVASARRAGFSRTVILRDPRKPFDQPVDPELVPNHFIDTLKELLQIFPPHPRRQGLPRGDGAPVHNLALSTMWAKNNFPALGDFFQAAENLGFSNVELNHQMNSAILEGVDLGRQRIGSIHEPCPADVSMDTLKQRDWLISSPEEERRQLGVAAVKRSIELAGRLSVRTVVVHCGQVALDLTDEKKLRDLHKAGLAETGEYARIKGFMEEKRLDLIGPCMRSVEKSLKELLEFAGRFGVRLGLENRYHYFDLPSQDEMEVLLGLAGPDRFGFICDVGHAAAMDRMGFYPSEMWLKRFGSRIIGAHLHDVTGLTDHLAPGLGDVDFRLVAAYLPRDAFRTLEVMSSNTPEQIKNGLKILVDSGCVNLIQ